MHKRNTPLFENNTKTITTLEVNNDLVWIYAQVKKSNVRRSANYDLNVNKSDTILAYTVTYLEETPVLASIAWTRPFYGGAVRVATKYCVSPDYMDKDFGKGTKNLIRLDTVDHIIQQYEICEMLGYSKFFISQEDKTKGKRVNKYISTLNELTDFKWKSTEVPVLVCPDCDNPSCWQYVISNEDIIFNYD